MKRLLARIILKSIGWKTKCNIKPEEHPQAVIVAAPHTTNWDFFYTLFGMWNMGIHMNFLIKDSFFFFPLGLIMKGLGGIPVTRSKSMKLVDQVIEKFNKGELEYLILSAEGTRSYVEKWKSGFYYMAQGANVPLFLGYVDYGNKVIGIEENFNMTGDYEKDIVVLKSYFSEITPKYPAKFGH